MICQNDNKHTECSLNQCSFWSACRSYQMAWLHQEVTERTLWFGLFYSSIHSNPQTGSSLRVWLEANPMQRFVISVWHVKRAHLFHMPQFSILSPTLGVKSVTQWWAAPLPPDTLGSYQPLNWAWLAGSANWNMWGYTTERNYYSHLPKHLLRSQ